MSARRAGVRRVAVVVLAPLVLLVAACGISDAAMHDATSEAEADSVFRPTTAVTPQAEPTAAATPEPLAEDEITEVLREVICWHDQPALARECLPLGPEDLELLHRIAHSDDARLVAPLIDMLWLEVGWERWVREALERVAGRELETAAEWYRWLAEDPQPLPDGYPDWKGRLLSFIDPQFTDLLHPGPGVGPERLIWAHLGPRDLEPLPDPEMIHRVEERYLASGDRVFGVVVDGVVRAYPERVLAWHGLVHDSLDGHDIVMWHCVPCGGAVAFEATASDGTVYDFGLSGLAYESRHLFFDEQTHSLWDPVAGRPVHGPLVDEDVSLTRLHTARTSWGDWSARYPHTRVLSLDTGHVRDYDEGAALRQDAAADGPLLPVTELDDRLDPKRRVLGVSIDGEQMAYSLAGITGEEIVHDVVGGQEIVIVSQGPGSGAAVYAADGVTFEGQRGSGDSRELVDEDGTRWFLDDEALVNTRDSEERAVLPSQVVYWFSWSGAYPDTGVWTP